MSQSPSPPTRVENIDVHWNPADRSLHTEADYIYAGVPTPTHNVIDLTGWQFDYYVGELAKLQTAVLLPGTDDTTIARNVCEVQHDYWWGKLLPKPQSIAAPPIDTTAPNLTT
jgi:hypothetical protein